MPIAASPPMRNTQAASQGRTSKEVYLLRMLRDDAVSSFHLGGLEAEREWQRLEPVVRAALARAESEVSDDAACLTIHESVHGGCGIYVQPWPERHGSQEMHKMTRRRPRTKRLTLACPLSHVKESSIRRSRHEAQRDAT